MSESHDQSYYEIALTNRQVMSIFVVLLVCVLASFLGGVWLGRDAEPKVEVAASQAILAGDAADLPLEPLDFFDREKPAAETSAGATDAGNRSAAADDGPAAQSQTGAFGAETADEPQGAGAKQASAGSARQPLGTRVEGSPGPATPEPDAASRKRAADPIQEALVIQVFSSNEEAQALRVADQLRKSGYPAILSPVEVAGRTLHRVRIGPYSDSDEAQVVAESVRRAFEFDTWITH